MAEQENLEVVRGTIDAINARDLDRFAQAFDAECVWESEAFPAPASGPEAVREVMQGYVDALGVEVEVEREIAQGDDVVSCLRYAGTHTGEFLGLAPTDQPVSGQVCNVITLANGKIVRQVSYFDNASLLQQIGVELPTAQAQTEA